MQKLRDMIKEHLEITQTNSPDYEWCANLTVFDENGEPEASITGYHAATDSLINSIKSHIAKGGTVTVDFNI